METITLIVSDVRNNKNLGDREVIVPKALYEKVMKRPAGKRGRDWENVRVKEVVAKETPLIQEETPDEVILPKKRTRNTEVSNG